MSYPEAVYDGAGEASAWVRRGDAEPDLRYPTGVTVRHLALGTETRGAFGLYRWDFSPARTGPDPHFHRTISESFFVLSGVVTIFDGLSWGEHGPGDYVFVPEGGIHGFRNESGAPASMLLLFAPGAPREEYFDTLAHLADHPMNDEECATFMLCHDNHWV